LQLPKTHYATGNSKIILSIGVLGGKSLPNGCYKNLRCMYGILALHSALPQCEGEGRGSKAGCVQGVWSKLIEHPPGG